MADLKGSENFGVTAEATGEKSGQHQEHAASIRSIPKEVQDNTEVCADINNVAALGLDNADHLEKLIVRRLDTFMMPQLWILYMFNYLNRTNIAQARLNTFDEDLNLRDGDYQVFQSEVISWIVSY